MKTKPVRPLRSLWGTTPIISIASNSKAESLLGIKSDTLVYNTYFITRAFKFDLSAWCTYRPMRAIVSIFVFIWAVCRYDIFHFFADRGLLPSLHWRGISPLELKILKFLKKKVFVHTYGSDIRVRSTTERLGKYNCCRDCTIPEKACVCIDAKQNRNIDNIRRDATALLTMGDMQEYAPESDKSVYFWSVDTARITYNGVRPDNAHPIKIVHAPNHREFKGTDYLVSAVGRLKADGLPIVLILVENTPNIDALKIYAEADIVAEQFLIGWHGYHALEAMAMGKPVISYIRKKSYLLDAGNCPIISANPDELEGALRDMVKHPLKRKELGDQGRAYVEKNYSLHALAERLRSLYERNGIKLPPAAVPKTMKFNQQAKHLTGVS